MKLRLVFYPNPPPGIVPLLQADAIRISFPEPLVSSPRFSFTPRRQFQVRYKSHIHSLFFFLFPSNRAIILVFSCVCASLLAKI